MKNLPSNKQAGNCWASAALCFVVCQASSEPSWPAAVHLLHGGVNLSPPTLRPKAQNKRIFWKSQTIPFQTHNKSLRTEVCWRDVCYSLSLAGSETCPEGSARRKARELFVTKWEWRYVQPLWNQRKQLNTQHFMLKLKYQHRNLYLNVCGVKSQTGIQNIQNIQAEVPIKDRFTFHNQVFRHP